MGAKRRPLPGIPVIQTKTRILGSVFLATEGRWAIRERCPDGVVRQFTTEPVYAVKKATRAGMRPSVRFDVLSRDRYTCRYCGRSAPEVALHVDHVVPVAEGGTDDPSNLVAACQDCNLGKSVSAA